MTGKHRSGTPDVLRRDLACRRGPRSVLGLGFESRAASPVVARAQRLRQDDLLRCVTGPRARRGTILCMASPPTSIPNACARAWPTRAPALAEGNLTAEENSSSRCVCAGDHTPDERREALAAVASTSAADPLAAAVRRPAAAASASPARARPRRALTSTAAHRPRRRGAALFTQLLDATSRRRPGARRHHHRSRPPPRGARAALA